MKLNTNKVEVKTETTNTCCGTSNEIKSGKANSSCEDDSCCEDDFSCCDNNLSMETNSKTSSCC